MSWNTLPNLKMPADGLGAFLGQHVLLHAVGEGLAEVLAVDVAQHLDRYALGAVHLDDGVGRVGLGLQVDAHAVDLEDGAVAHTVAVEHQLLAGHFGAGFDLGTAGIDGLGRCLGLHSQRKGQGQQGGEEGATHGCLLGLRTGHCGHAVAASRNGLARRRLTNSRRYTRSGHECLLHAAQVGRPRSLALATLKRA
jgi:hypothetical protein